MTKHQVAQEDSGKPAKGPIREAMLQPRHEKAWNLAEVLARLLEKPTSEALLQEALNLIVEKLGLRSASFHHTSLSVITSSVQEALDPVEPEGATPFTLELNIELGSHRLGRLVMHAGQQTALPSERAQVALSYQFGLLVFRHLDITAVDAHTIEPASNTRKQDEHVAQLASLVAVGQQLVGFRELRPLMQFAAQRVQRLFGHGVVGVFLLEEDPSEGPTLAIQHGLLHTSEPTPDGYRQSVKVGILGYVARTGEPVLSNNVEQDPRFFDLDLLFGTRSEMAVPIRIGTEIVGVVDVQSVFTNAFDQSDFRGLQILADQLSVAIENVRLYQQVTQRVREMQAIYQIVLEIAGTLDVHEVLYSIVQQVRTLLQSSGCSIYLLNKKSKTLTLEAMDGHAQSLMGATLKLGEGMAGWVAQTGEPLMIADYTTWHGRAPHLANAGFGPVLETPLKVSGEVIGVIAVTNRREERAFNEEDLRILNLLSSQAAVAVENARLYAEAQSRLEALMALRAVGLDVTHMLDLNQLLRSIVERAAALLRAPAGGLYLYDEISDSLELVVAHNLGTRQVGLRLKRGEGLSGKILETRQPLIVDHYENWEYRADIFRGRQFGGVIGAPLLWNEKLLGVINITSIEETHHFDANDVQTLTLFAQQAAVAITNARLFKDTQRQLGVFQALYETSLDLLADVKLEDRLNTVLRRATELLMTTSGNIFMVDENKEELRVVAEHGVEKSTLGSILRSGQGVAGRVYESKEAFFIHDYSQWEGRASIYENHNLHAVLGAPLIIQGRVVGVLMVFDQRVSRWFNENDVSLLKFIANQAAVMIENARLYTEMSERATQLEQANRELKQLDRMKDEFMQNMTHELRTPLTYMRGYVDLLLEKAIGPLTDEQESSLRVMRERTDSLTRLVNRIISLKTAELEDFEPKIVNIVALAELAIRAATVTARKANVALVLNAEENLPQVIGDADRLGEVFDNLIGNAIKFSPNGGAVTTTLRSEGSHIVCEIADQGIGISAEHITSIWTRFYQVDGSARRRFDGAGVGLTIVKRIIEAHGGTVDVQSQEGHGSTFRFTVLIAPSSLQDTERYDFIIN